MERTDLGVNGPWTKVLGVNKPEANARVCERFGPEGEQSRATSLGTNFAGANGPDPLQSRQKERFYSIVNEFQSVVKKKIQGTSLIFVLLHNVRDFLPFYRNGLV